MERKLEFIDGLESARAMANVLDLFTVMPKNMNHDDRRRVDDEGRRLGYPGRPCT